MREVVRFLAVVAWLAGFVLAKGVVSTIACVIPFWSWYLVVEKLMVSWGMA